MSPYSLVALLLTVTGLLAYLNAKFLRLPSTVGLMGLSALFSLFLLGAGALGLPLRSWAAGALSQVNFSEALLDGMLSFMLFAGSLHVDLNELKERRITIALLATVGVLISTTVVGFCAWLLFHWLGLQLPLLACLTFGALISPTDPIAVLDLLKNARAPLAVSTEIAGESLFNDGIGIVVFLLMLGLWADGAHSIPWRHTGLLLLREVGGGLALGLVLGFICFILLKTIDNYRTEVMLTLALVSGGYQLASMLHASGALAIVTAGIIVGNYGRRLAMSSQTRKLLDGFWELLDEILNGILFVLIGFEVLLLEFKESYLVAGLIVIPIILLARMLSLYVPLHSIRIFAGKQRTPLSVLTWGGLRGGISIALALTLPIGYARDVILVSTYSVVAFSILVQAPSMGWLLKRTLPANPDGV